MKLRVTGLMLGLLIALSVVIPGFAAAADEKEQNAPAMAETAPVSESAAETGEETTDDFASTSPFYLNGEPVEGLEYECVNGHNYITVESFVKALSTDCEVLEENGSVTADCVTVTEIVDVEAEGVEAAANVIEETLTISAKFGERYLTANGRCLYVENGVKQVNGKVALPIRSLAEVCNLDIAYDGATGQIVMNSIEGAGAYLTPGSEYYDGETLYWLSHIIYAESGNQSLSGKIAVGNVVMNRLSSPKFPNTIKGVLFQKNQFSPAMSGSIYREPNAASVAAAKLVLEGTVVLENALFFNRAGMNTYASRNRPYVATIGAHAFYN